MARKTLLTESEIRQFMKLANIKPLQEMGYDMPGMRDEEEDPLQEEEEELEMDAEAPAPPMDAEAPMDAELGDEEMEMDVEPMDDMGMEAEGGDKEDAVMAILDALKDLVGDEVDLDVSVGDEAEDLGGEVEADEGGDLEVDAAPEVVDMEPVPDDEGMGDDEIVQEVARRVAARLLREKKTEDVANKLAERIFRRLASK
tara:strand:- start:4174 stop:4773 length:600 start_codon:yes stop_codon:yes gene_type:complete